MYYSPSTKGFYDPQINSDIPSDKVSLTETQYLDLLASQSEGKVIQANGSGVPVAVDVSVSQAQLDAAWNANVDAQLNAADIKIIRALTEGDTARVNAHKAAQAALRATRR